MAELESGRLRAGGLDMAYDSAGHGSPALVLIHGFMASRADFQDVLPILGERRRAIAYDLRGHGDTSHAPDPASYTLDRLAEDLGQLLDRLGLGRVHLFGHSMGGMVAHRFALAAPERVQSLILSSTSAHPVILSRELMMKTPPWLFDRTTKSWEKVDTQGALFLRAHFGAVPSLGHSLRSMKCPTLALVGADDPQFRATIQEIAREIPEATLVELEGVGHQPHLEAPGRWVDEVERHLARCSASG